MATLLGGAAGDDVLFGSRIQSDGTIVLAGRVSSKRIGALVPILLNGAKADSAGVVLRLSHDGKRLLSVTRVAAAVFDLALDACDNIYIAASQDGVLKLDSQASKVLWSDRPGFVYRVDASPDGTIAVLRPSNAKDPDSSSGAGKIAVYSSTGKKLADFAGTHNTTDLCVDGKSRTVIYLGWRQANAFDGKKTFPVQISFLKGADYGGKTKWTNYDWSTDRTSARFINKPTNNMADSRGYRCSIGADGKLYAAFEVAGGNHIFRYSPTDITQKVPIVGGDHFHGFQNSKSEHKTFFARYEPASGKYLLGQQLCARLSSGRANTVRVKQGEIIADSTGRVLLAGVSASGFPFTYVPAESGTYMGGSYVLLMSADFKKRLFATHSSSASESRAVGARVFGSKLNIAFVGQHKTASKEILTLHPLQAASGGGELDGFAAVVGGHPAVGPGRPASCGGSPPRELPTARENSPENTSPEPVLNDKAGGGVDGGSTGTDGLSDVRGQERGQKAEQAVGFDVAGGQDRGDVPDLSTRDTLSPNPRDDRGSDSNHSATGGCSCSSQGEGRAGLVWWSLFAVLMWVGWRQRSA